MNKFLILAIVAVVIGMGGFFVFGNPSSKPLVQTNTTLSQPSITVTPVYVLH